MPLAELLAGDKRTQSRRVHEHEAAQIDHQLLGPMGAQLHDHRLQLGCGGQVKLPSYRQYAFAFWVDGLKAQLPRYQVRPERASGDAVGPDEALARHQTSRTRCLAVCGGVPVPPTAPLAAPLAISAPQAKLRRSDTKTNPGKCQAAQSPQIASSGPHR